MRRSLIVGLGILTLGCIALVVAALLFREARAVRSEVAELAAGAQLVAEATGGLELEAVLARQSADSTSLSEIEEASGRPPQLLQKALHDLFVAFGIEVLATTPWQSESDNNDKTRVIFSKTFELRGELGALVDALHSLEGWPDRLMVTRLSLLPDAEGGVQCKWQITAVREAPDEGESA